MPTPPENTTTSPQSQVGTEDWVAGILEQPLADSGGALREAPEAANGGTLSVTRPSQNSIESPSLSRLLLAGVDTLEFGIFIEFAAGWSKIVARLAQLKRAARGTGGKPIGGGRCVMSPGGRANYPSHLATIFKAVTATTRLPGVRATAWSMSWEMQFLESCRKLRESAESLTTALQSLADLVDAVELQDVSLSQLKQVYRLAYELFRSVLPEPEILLRDRPEELKQSVAIRRELLDRCQQASQTLESALMQFCRVMNVSLPTPVHEVWLQALFQLAGELERPQMPPAELIFHEQLDAIALARIIHRR